MSRGFPDRTPRWRRYLRFWRPDIHADTDDELRLHFASRIDELIATGLPREAASAQATGEFGDLDAVRSDLREIDGSIARRRSRGDLFGALRDDVRYTVRSLGRSRGFVVMVVTAMALGLGLNAAMFTFLDEVFFRPPAGVSDPGSVRRVWITDYNTTTREPGARNFTNYPTYAALERTAREAPIAVYSIDKTARLGHGESARTAVRAYTTSNYASVLGARVARGRWYTDAETQFGTAAPVSVVSMPFARRESIDVGSRLYVDGITTSVIGIADERFTGPDLDAVDVWMPIGLNRDRAGDGKPWWQSPWYYGLMMISRVDHTTNERVLGQRLTVAARAAARDTHYGDTLDAVSFGPINYQRGPGDRAPEVEVATRLAAVAVLVLLIACANVINLLLARAVMRRRELAIRVALGVARRRLIRLMTTESLVLAVLAGGAALLAAYWGGALLRNVLLPRTHWAESPVSWRVVGFTIAASILAGLVVGVVPAIRASAPNMNTLLRGGGDAGSPQRSRLRAALVGVQAALALVLLVMSLLFVQSLRNVEGIDIGYDASRLLFANVHFETRPKDAGRITDQAYRALAAELAGVRGVKDVTLTSMVPMRGFSWITTFVNGDSLEQIIADPAKLPTFTAVSPSYFRTVGMHIVRGEGFAEHVARQAVVVNEEMARLIWHGADPIGQCLHFTTPAAPCYQVIGIVSDAHRDGVLEPQRYGQYYLPIDAMPIAGWGAGTVIIRADPRAMPAAIADVRSRLRRLVSAGEPVLTRMTEYLDPEYRPYRLGATLFTAFGVLALMVTLVGIYSTVAYGVQQRAHEFSIRVALGATVRDVVRHIVGQELRVVTIGLLIGAALVVAGGRFVASLLYGIAPYDARVLGAVAGLLLVAAVIAALGPAWRAGRADPVSALRSE